LIYKNFMRIIIKIGKEITNQLKMEKEMI